MGGGISYPLQYNWASLVAQLVKNLPALTWTVRSPGEGIGYSLQYSVQVNFMDCIVHGVAKTERRDSLSTPAFVDFPCGSAGKESACNVGDLGLIPGLGRSPGEGNNYPLQYSRQENPMDCDYMWSQRVREWRDYPLQYFRAFPVA